MNPHTVQRNANECRVMLGADLIAATVPALRSELMAEIDKGASEVIFDFGRTAMLDSTGIGLLVAAHNSLGSRQGKMSVVGVSDDVLKLLATMRLVNRFNVKGRAFTHA